MIVAEAMANLGSRGASHHRRRNDLLWDMGTCEVERTSVILMERQRRARSKRPATLR